MDNIKIHEGPKQNELEARDSIDKFKLPIKYYKMKRNNNMI